MPPIVIIFTWPLHAIFRIWIIFYFNQTRFFVRWSFTFNFQPCPSRSTPSGTSTRGRSARPSATSRPSSRRLSRAPPSSPWSRSRWKGEGFWCKGCVMRCRLYISEDISPLRKLVSGFWWKGCAMRCWLQYMYFWYKSITQDVPLREAVRSFSSIKEEVKGKQEQLHCHLKWLALNHEKWMNFFSKVGRKESSQEFIFWQRKLIFP